MKTLEFKLYLTLAQQETIANWLSALKYPWNAGVKLIKLFNEFNKYDKRFKAIAPCCPIASYNHALRIVNAKNRERSESLKENEYLSCPIGWQLNHYTGLSSVIETREIEQTVLDEQKLVSGLVGTRSPMGIFPVALDRGGKLVKNLSFFELQAIFTHKRNADKPWLCEVNSKFIDGTVKTLADAWVAFLEGKRKPPLFKGKNQRIDTLIHNNTKPSKEGKIVVQIEGDRIKIPKLGWVRAKGLRDRWPEGLVFCPLKICRKASGYYLQLSGDVPSKPVKKLPQVDAIGLDPGVEAVYTDDAGRRVKVPTYLEKDLNKLKELQRKAQRQWDNNQKDKDWCRKNWRKTQDKIAKLHEKIARRGRAFNHFESTKLSRIFKNIYLEDYKVSEVVGKVAPVESGNLVINKQGELTKIFEKNGRDRNRDMNRAALRNRVGQLWTMIETKAGKRVVRVERSGTSSECPRCGHIEEKLLRQRTHLCKQCGCKMHRDKAAAQIIKKRGQATQQKTS